MLSAKEAKQREIEESKYLGGDVKRTHLVKGLDVALLRKTRMELQVEDMQRRELELQQHNEKAEAARAAKRKTPPREHKKKQYEVISA